MTTSVPTREQALAILKEFNKADKAIRHALAVEAVRELPLGRRYFLR